MVIGKERRSMTLCVATYAVERLQQRLTKTLLRLFLFMTVFTWNRLERCRDTAIEFL